MKVIVDAGFPPLDDIRCHTMRMELYKRKRQYAYEELKDGTIYIHFPRITPWKWVWDHIRFYLWSRHRKDDDDEDNEELVT